jgi:uncharacterized SAM-binding protein YcdF (DUF218 family)
LFTEVLGQACFNIFYGGFPDVQKLVILSDFDSCFVGRVRGYRIENGDLVPDASGVIHQQAGSVMAKRSMSTKSVASTNPNYVGGLKPPATVSSEAQKRILTEIWNHGIRLASAKAQALAILDPRGIRKLVNEELSKFRYPAALRDEAVDYMLSGIREGGEYAGYLILVGKAPGNPALIVVSGGRSRRSSGFIEGSPVASTGIGFVVGAAIGAGVMHLARRSS